MNDTDLDQRHLSLDTLLVEAEALWVDDMLDQATPPAADGALSGDALVEAEAQFGEFLTSEETRQIVRIIFQLKAARIDDPEKMEALIDRHNAALVADINDEGYDRRTGIRKQRLKGALMETPAQKEIMLSAVRHGPGSLHKNGFCKLLTRMFNHNRVGFALDVLARAGFLSRRAGANNSEILVSDGRLENIYKAYLDRIASGACS